MYVALYGTLTFPNITLTFWTLLWAFYTNQASMWTLPLLTGTAFWTWCCASHTPLPGCGSILGLDPSLCVAQLTACQKILTSFLLFAPNHQAAAFGGGLTFSHCYKEAFSTSLVCGFGGGRPTWAPSCPSPFPPGKLSTPLQRDSVLHHCLFKLFIMAFSLVVDNFCREAYFSKFDNELGLPAHAWPLNFYPTWPAKCHTWTWPSFARTSTPALPNWAAVLLK